MHVKIFLLIILLSLQACVSVATSGASAVYNHQSIQKNLNDQYITLRSYQALDIDSDHFKNTNISISTFNRVVLITGQVPEAWQKTEAEQLVKKTVKKLDNVDEVYNLITVDKKISHLTRLSDIWLTTKIKAKMVASNDLDVNQVKVVTENGTVYLMGILQPSAAKAAVLAASQTDGVREVVKIFSYINISKTPV